MGSSSSSHSQSSSGSRMGSSSSSHSPSSSGSSSNWNSSSNNGSTSSGRITMTSEEFLKRNENYIPRSCEDIKQDALNSILKNGQKTSNTSSNQPNTTGLRNRSSSGINSLHNGDSTSSSCGKNMTSEDFLKNNSDYKPSSAQAIKQEALKSVISSDRLTFNTSSHRPETEVTSDLKQPQNGTGSLQTSLVPPKNNSNLITSTKAKLSENDITTRHCSSSPTVLFDKLSINQTSDVKSDLIVTGNDSQSEIAKQNIEISKKHEQFLKKLVATFDVFSPKKTKGFFCSVCNIYELYLGKPTTEKSCDGKPTFLTHDQTDEHVRNLGDKSGVKGYRCSQCRAYFFGDIKFWVDHVKMDLHEFFAAKRNSQQLSNGMKNNKSFSESNEKLSIGRISDEVNKPFSSMPPFVMDNDCINSGLILKKSIAKNFYARLINVYKGSYCFYCHPCKLWTDDNDVWVKHTENHKKDLKFNFALKNCIHCRIIIIGDEKLEQYHSADGNHENFKQFLAARLKISEKNKIGEDLSLNDSCDSDDNEDNLLGKDKTNKKVEIEKKSYALLIKGFPKNTKRNVVFDSLKDYGRLDKIFMDFAGPHSAKVTFKYPRCVAWNLVKNEAPIVIQNKKVEISLIEV